MELCSIVISLSILSGVLGTMNSSIVKLKDNPKLPTMRSSTLMLAEPTFWTHVSGLPTLAALADTVAASSRERIDAQGWLSHPLRVAYMSTL